jgi:hypothetical protein
MTQFFAKIEEGIVTNIIVATPEFISQQPGIWIETFYGDDARKAAGIGFFYDTVRESFLPPIPGPEYQYNEITGKWEINTAFLQWKSDVEAALLDLASRVSV